MRYLVEGLLVIVFAISPVLPILPFILVGACGGDVSSLDHSSLAVLPFLVFFTVPIAAVYLWLRLLWILGSVLWKDYWNSQ